MISALHDDLLVDILSRLRTKDVVVTMVLSKRWRFLWSMVPKLGYVDNDGDFIDKSMHLHRATSLDILRIQFNRFYHVDADVGNCVSFAVKRCVRELRLHLLAYYYSKQQNLPACVYTCKTLVKLTLSNNILVDVPSVASLPSLESMKLISVVYKDEDSHVRLLSSCPVLKHLYVSRSSPDNIVTRFTVKVPSLQKLTYRNKFSRSSLAIDSPGLNYFEINTPFEHYCSIQNMPRLDVALVRVYCGSHQDDDKLLASFSSIMFLDFSLKSLRCCSGINFSRLIEVKLHASDKIYYWLEQLMLLLHNSPKLKVLMISSVYHPSEDLQLSWNQSSYVVPECLSSHLETFEWYAYRGTREEREFVAYILANSKCLKTTGISPRYSYSRAVQLIKKLKSMYRVSASSQLVFSTHLKWRYR